MSTELQTFLALVQKNTGRDDADFVAVATAGLNYAAYVAAILFEPFELVRNQTITLGVAVPTWSLSGLTYSWRDIIKLYNSTSAKEMYFMPLDKWFLLPSPGWVKFWTLQGSSLLVKDTPGVDTSAVIYYQSYPSTMVNSTDQVGFSGFDSFILSCAQTFVFASLEEGDSAAVWSKVMESFTIPSTLGVKARDVMAQTKIKFESAWEELQKR